MHAVNLDLIMQTSRHQGSNLASSGRQSAAYTVALTNFATETDKWCIFMVFQHRCTEMNATDFRIH